MVHMITKSKLLHTKVLEEVYHFPIFLIKPKMSMFVFSQ